MSGLVVRSLTPAEQLLVLHPAPWSLGKRWPLPQSGSAAFEVLDANCVRVQPLAFDGLVFAEGIVEMVNDWATAAAADDHAEARRRGEGTVNEKHLQEFVESVRRAAGEVH